jgi:glyceraldehyde 3-phosphate dehydrogenase
MSTRVGINGFGRIGRLALRAAWGWPDITFAHINELKLKTAADSSLKGILGYEERPLVSIDYKDDPRSAIVDAPSTMVTDGTQVKILAWYDNEWGYANRLVELARIVAISLSAA